MESSPPAEHQLDDQEVRHPTQERDVGVGAREVAVENLDQHGQPQPQREASVLHALAAGRSNTEIARSMHLSVETVKTHVKHVLNKLEVRDRTQAVVWAYRTGFVHRS
jgi:DNA-binding NarL/FixJ family response regulator